MKTELQTEIIYNVYKANNRHKKYKDTLKKLPLIKNTLCIGCNDITQPINNWRIRFNYISSN